MQNTMKTKFGMDDQKSSLGYVESELLLKQPNEDAGCKDLDMLV